MLVQIRVSAELQMHVDAGTKILFNCRHNSVRPSVHPLVGPSVMVHLSVTHESEVLETRICTCVCGVIMAFSKAESEKWFSCDASLFDLHYSLTPL